MDKNINFIKNCIFQDGSFNFRKFYSYFINKGVIDLERDFKGKIVKKKKLEEKLEKRKIKKLETMIIYEKDENDSSYDINPFYDIYDYNSNYNPIQNIEKVNILSKDVDFNTTYREVDYPFWFFEDEFFFGGKSLNTIKKDSYPSNLNKEYLPFNVFNDKEDFLSINLVDIPVMEKRILETIKNTKKIANEDYTPLIPEEHIRDYKKSKVSDQEKFMIKIMECCHVGHENDPDEGIMQITPNIKTKKFSYLVDFCKIRKYFN